MDGPEEEGGVCDTRKLPNTIPYALSNMLCTNRTKTIRRSIAATVLNLVLYILLVSADLQDGESLIDGVGTLHVWLGRCEVLQYTSMKYLGLMKMHAL